MTRRYVPIWVALLAIRFRPDERSTGSRAVGILLGLAGVVVLTGATPGRGWWGVAGIAAVVMASISYAIAGLYGQRLIERVSGPVLSATTLIGATVLILGVVALGSGAVRFSPTAQTVPQAP